MNRKITNFRDQNLIQKKITKKAYNCTINQILALNKETGRNQGNKDQIYIYKRDRLKEIIQGKSHKIYYLIY